MKYLINISHGLTLKPKPRAKRVMTQCGHGIGGWGFILGLVGGEGGGYIRGVHLYGHVSSGFGIIIAGNSNYIPHV